MEEKAKKTAAKAKGADKAADKKVAAKTTKAKAATKATATEKAPVKKAATKTPKAKAAETENAPVKKAATKTPKTKAAETEKAPVKKAATKTPKAKAAETEKAPVKKAAAKTPKAKATDAEKAAEKKATKATKSKPAEKKDEAIPPAPKAKSATKKAKETAAAPAEAPAAPAPSTSEGEKPKKVRTKPRRRELKRLGLLKPKENKKQKRIDEARAREEEARAQKSAAGKAAQKDPREAKRKEKEKKDLKRAQKKAQREAEKPAEVPAAFETFKPRANEKLERKADRKEERRHARIEKEERERDQSQGLFEEPIRLNRFVALSGVCSRRDADGLIAAGKVTVNGKVVKEMGHKVMPGKDRVAYNDRELKIKVFVYLLMNKPKNRITTTEDELGRDTVMEIAERYTKVRVYPVGRLDRNTTGLLLLTNDGDLTQKLTHPSSKFPKVYQMRLDKDFREEDMLALRKGFQLEDGFIKADKADYIVNGGLNEIGIQIHSGANHIVKRMMAHLGYEVVTLDRVQFGPLDKRGLPRGRCRLLSEKEIGFLKML